MGMGGSIYTAGADTFSGYYNPAGLGFIDTVTLGLVSRTMSQSQSSWSGSFKNPTVNTKGQSGAQGISHAAVVLPLSKNGRRSGTLSLDYTVGGYIRDVRTSSGDLTLDANTSIRNYAELLKSKTDFFTLAYGNTSPAGNVAWGIGFVYASNYILNRQSYSLVTNGTETPNPPLDLSGTSNGFGVIAGVQIIPKGTTTSIGASIRTPISLHGSSISGYYDRIPGRASLGVAMRRDGLRGGSDYLLYGLQGDLFWGGNSNATYAQKKHLAIGGGFEYNYALGDTRIPIRMGYRAVQSANNSFKATNAFTLGLGYRPSAGNFALDVNVAFPSGGGGKDLAFGITYRPNR